MKRHVRHRINLRVEWNQMGAASHQRKGITDSQADASAYDYEQATRQNQPVNGPRRFLFCPYS